MMRLLAYCIVGRPRGRVRAQPIAGRTVRLVTAGPLAAAVSDSVADPCPAVEEVLAFEAVVEWFHARCPAVIPVRFGALFPDEAALRAALRRDAGRYRDLLARLDGAVEIAIRVPAAPLPAAPRVPGSPASGAAWLEARRRYYDELDHSSVAGQLRTELQGLFRQSRHEFGGSVLWTYFLVPRADAPAFLQRAQQVTAARANASISGPWPPYNFTAAACAGQP